MRQNEDLIFYIYIWYFFLLRIQAIPHMIKENKITLIFYIIKLFYIVHYLVDFVYCSCINVAS